LKKIFSYYKPQIIFHAAAYKHVPIIELNACEAIYNNVIGTKNIAEVSHESGVERFILFSTDKAVRPANVMGATKRVAEMITSCYASNSAHFVSVRFGNVIGSEGSVVHLFKKQIERFGPVTVTHPEITRYFMTIPEACQLVLEAGCIGKGSEIFVFDMGKPVRIADLANQMIRLSGLVPGKDIEIVYTGLRPGEKLFEELLTDREHSKPTPHPKIKIAEVEKLDKNEILVRIEALLNNLYSFSKKDVVNYCHLLVPEYKSNNGNYKEQPERSVSQKVEEKAKAELISQIYLKNHAHQ